MSGKTKQICRQAGCRAAVARGFSYCQAHQRNRPAMPQTASPPVLKTSLYAKYMTAEELDKLAEIGEAGLEGEIQVARLVVARLLERDDLEAVGKALYAVRALVAEHRKESGDQAGGIVNGLQQVLDELGLGDNGGEPSVSGSQT